MQKISAREYARRNKMSLFEVIKKINAGELQAQIVEEDGVNRHYILLENPSKEIEQKPKKHKTPPIDEKESLFKEIDDLRRRIERLEILVGRLQKGD